MSRKPLYPASDTVYTEPKQGRVRSFRKLSRCKPNFPRFMVCLDCQRGYVNDTLLCRAKCPNCCGPNELLNCSTAAEAMQELEKAMETRARNSARRK